MSRQIADYLNIRWVEQPKKIPNSKKITYIYRDNALPQLYEFDLEKKVERQLVVIEGRVLSAVHSKSGKYTILEVDYKGNEKRQLFLYNHHSQHLKKLVYSPERFHEFGDFFQGEKKILYTAYEESKLNYHIYTIDLESEEKELLFTCNEVCTVVKWIENTDCIVCKIQETNIDSSYWIFDINNLSKEKIGTKNKLARYQSLSFTKKQGNGFVVSDIDHEYLQLYQFSMLNPEELVPVIQSIPWDIEQIKLSKDESRIALTVNEGGTSSLYIYDRINDHLEKVQNLPMGVYSHVTWLDDHSFLFLLKGPKIPGELHMYNMEKSTLTRVTDVGYSDASQLRKYEPKINVFQSFDKREVPYFYYSNSQQPTRAVFYIHGGPENLSRVDFNPLLQALINEGFAVFVPNIRGSKGFGRSYLSLDDRRKRLDAVKDIKSLAEMAFNNYGIPKDKLGIIGRSYGGLMVNTVIALYPNLWAAAVSIVGISNISTFLENTGLHRRALREYEYGFLSEDRVYFDEIAPLHHAEYINTPLLLCHGENDSRVPVEESKQFKEKLLDLNKNVKLILSDKDGHQMGGHTSSAAGYVSMQLQIAEFLMKHVTSDKK